MEKYVIKGGVALKGEVEISGAKNAALALIAAAIMADENVTIENLPDVSDINQLIDAIETNGVTKKMSIKLLCISDIQLLLTEQQLLLTLLKRNK